MNHDLSSQETRADAPTSRLSDRVFAALWALVLIWYGYTALTLEVQFSYEPVGPKAFPLLLTVLMLGCVAWLLVKPDRNPRWPERTLAIKLGVMILALAIYAALFVQLGFLVSTALMTLAVGRLYEGTWKQSAIAAVVSSLGLYILFEYLLDVALPAGILGG
ncbi:MAG: tripartite tricarboxylate transporter TctB family protein [Candidatus Competibacteraceae bacterium]|nr:tripartite tricarboxylate transporter TctB family protein [Candidatus Competibacteraceae bacterium]